MTPSDVKILSPKSEAAFISSWYELAQDSHFWMQGRLFALLKQFRLNNIPVKHPLRGLEIGCGHGVLRSQIEQHTNWSIDGADLDLASLKSNPACRGDAYLYNIFERQHFFKEYYDFILLYDVIEHIEHVQAFLDASLYHLKPGGYVFFNMPALSSLYSNYDKFVGHLRRYDKALMERTIEDAGLKVIHINYWGLSFIPLLWVRKIFVAKDYEKDTIVQKGFNPKNSFLNALLKTVIRSEIALTPNPVLGTSVMAIAQKRS